MKKMLIIITCTLFLTACAYKKESKEYAIYKNYINELNEIKGSSVNNPLVININIEKISENLFAYTSLINKNKEKMNNVLALLIHNKETENAFPSVGIFDEKVTISNEEKGIKLTGYVENIEDIRFKLLIKYTNDEGKIVKYYYVEENPTISAPDN